MAGSRILSKCLNINGTYKNLFTNRIIYYQINANIKSEHKDKIKHVEIPEKPKRPLTPYIQFVIEQRPEIAAKHPQLTAIEIIKQCAQSWKTLDESKKLKYREIFNKQQAEYKKKCETFRDSLTEEQEEAMEVEKDEKAKKKELREKRKLRRENNKPKQAKTTFAIFIQEKMSKLEGIKKGPNGLKIITKEWNSLSDEDKEKYRKLQDIDKARYEKEMHEWESKMLQEGKIDLIRKHSSVLIEKKNKKL